MSVSLNTFLLHPRLRLLLLVLASLMYLTILVAGSIPGARADIGHYASGAVLHSTAYGVLAALWFLGTRGTHGARAAKAMLAVAVMGAGDEFVQSFFPYRGAAVGDWAVDCAAAAVTTLLLCLFVPKRLADPGH